MGKHTVGNVLPGMNHLILTVDKKSKCVKCSPIMRIVLCTPKEFLRIVSRQHCKNTPKQHHCFVKLDRDTLPTYNEDNNLDDLRSVTNENLSDTRLEDA